MRNRYAGKHWRSVGTIAVLLTILALPSSALSSPSLSASSAEQALNRGDGLYQAGKLEPAIAAWKQAQQHYRQLKDLRGESFTLLKIGSALVNLERYQEAVTYLESFLPMAKQSQNSQLEAQALSNLGIAYKSLGWYAKAIASHRQAGKLMRDASNLQGLGQVLANLGSAFEAVGDYSSAAIAFEQSIKLAQQTHDTLGESIALSNLGAIYANQGKDADAIATFQQSLAIAQKNRYLAGQASTLLNLGSTYHAQRDLKRAIQFYQESLALARTLGDRQREAEALGSLGLAYEDQKNFSLAIQHHQESLALARSLKDPEMQGTALNNLGHALFGAGQLAKAEATLREAIQLLDALRPGLQDTYKVSIFDTQLHTYSLLQQVLVAANKPETALEVAEWGRARAFAERLAKRVREGSQSTKNTQFKKNQSKSTGQSGQTVGLIKINDIRRIASEQKATLVEYAIVPDDDFKFRGKQRAREAKLLIWVVQPSGKVHLRQVNLQPLWEQDLTLEKLVAIARSCLYPGFDCSSATALRSGAASPPQFTPPPTPALPTSRRRQNPAFYRLHQLLIQPIADLLPTTPTERVIFIPQESLFLVPFPALQDDDSTYLIEHHTPSTAPSIQVLALTRQIKHQKGIANSQQERQGKKTSGRSRWSPALIVGNPTMPMIGTKSLSALPAAEAEAKQIAALFQVQPLLGGDATQQRVVQQMTHAKVVHLATHGLLEYGQALEDTDVPGAIALAPSKVTALNGSTGRSSTQIDGLLTSDEIFDLRLQADLVVLSACDTGRGRITGDGVIGLSRAFISSGVPSLVVSLWAVPDVSTSALMVQFYQNLLEQPDKAKALRLAMLETMKHYPRPLDWAAFTLIGEAE